MAVAEKERFRAAESCGRNIRILRKERQWKTGELARRAGFSQQEVSAVELGRINTPVETLHRLASALGVPMERLVDTSPDMLRVSREAFVDCCQMMQQSLDAVQGQMQYMHRIAEQGQ